ncbi:MAG: hypothetical protein APR63_00260 [Desulfuromonas sp. SDB]|nr:MAG: hypothetical protein APR63_00260 [Desulfuromonas sp. SDB]
MFQGCTVAMITPFTHGKLDIEGIKKNVDFYIEKGLDGILIAGTTGEGPSITDSEYRQLTDAVISQAGGKVKIMLNTGTNSTAKTIENVKFANTLEIDAILVITPYYNKPNLTGMRNHYLEISEHTELPIYIYNVPGRTGSNIDVKLVSELHQANPQITGIKEASGNLNRISELKLLCGPDFEILSGEDSLTLPSMCLGAQGVISVTANVVPDLVAAMTANALKGNWEEAKRIHYQIFNLTTTLFSETNPVPVKTAMKLMKLGAGELRTPLGEMQPRNFEILKKELDHLKLI